LRFGQYLGHALLKEGDFEADFTPCTNGIDEFWYILFVPAAALSWSGLFYPNRTDLPLMAFHGILGYGVNYSLTKAGVSAEVNNFIAASSISLSAGIISRFTGRQAVGNTVAGMYVLLPGAYLVKSLYQTEVDGSFLFDVISQAIIIGKLCKHCQAMIVFYFLQFILSPFFSHLVLAFGNEQELEDGQELFLSVPRCWEPRKVFWDSS